VDSRAAASLSMRSAIAAGVPTRAGFTRPVERPRTLRKSRALGL
jgi:hypothetical protein